LKGLDLYVVPIPIEVAQLSTAAKVCIFYGNQPVKAIDMAVTAKDWSVVIVGRWNKAILTPAGIARRLFCLEKDIPVEVLIPLDMIATPQVRYDKLVVVARNDRLIIQPEEFTYSSLARAMEIGVHALQSLPETPLSAVGINVKWSAPLATETLQDVTKKTGFDNLLSESNFVISGRSIARTLDWRGGRITVAISEEYGEPFEILLNFELRSSDSQQQIDWLSANVQDIEEQVTLILYQCIQLQPEA
jgi:hypothetical protein